LWDHAKDTADDLLRRWLWCHAVWKRVTDVTPAIIANIKQLGDEAV